MKQQPTKLAAIAFVLLKSFVGSIDITSVQFYLLQEIFKGPPLNETKNVDWTTNHDCSRRLRFYVASGVGGASARPVV